jgi:hypothetical protein
MEQFSNKHFEAQEAEAEQEAERKERADELRWKLESRINSLVRRGIFPEDAGREWIDACADDPPEWVQEVLDALSDYEAAGEKVLGDTEEVLQSPSFSDKERAIWMSYFEDASYQERLALLGRLRSIDKARTAERESVKQAPEVTDEVLVTKIRLAISADRLGEASDLLQTLDPKKYELSYLRLLRDLEKAQSQKAREQYNAALATAA